MVASVTSVVGATRSASTGAVQLSGVKESWEIHW